LGQDVVSSVLREAGRQDKIAHAYVLSGPRGTGKTSTARLIAKLANCEKRKTNTKFKEKGEPCNECPTCKHIDEGALLDVIEIDAASNRGIDEIRDLKENVRVRPSSAEKKIFIIDEAHMLTKEAWNALLKTLEEPPEYVIIILATTEFEKVPGTIASRTQQFFFSHIPLETLVKKLSIIAKEENIQIGKEALELIASSAEGSFRDAESILDQLITFKGKEVDIHEVESMLGKIGFDTISHIAELLLSGKKEVFDELHMLEDKGAHISQFTKDLIHYLRRVTTLAMSPSARTFLEKELMKDHVDMIAKHAEIWNKKHIELLKSLIKAYGDMRYSKFPIIHLEVAIAENL
jgi:DNA polymerase-3 subunit gamma/tau